MEKLQFECEQYKLYSPDSLKYITDNMHDILIDKIEEFKELFGIDNLEQLQINYFDDLDKFRSFIYDLRGEKKSLSTYARGTYDKGMINASLDKDIVVGSSRYRKVLHMANHELFHILYMKYVLNNDFSKRVIWYDEGMAQFMSGENDVLLDDKKLEWFYLKAKEGTKVIPELNSLTHGNSFLNENYNGYTLSYLSIRYLSETLGKEEFKNLMYNIDLIKEYGKTVLNDMFDYYDKKYLNGKNTNELKKVKL